MAKTEKKVETDITKIGPMRWKQLQMANMEKQAGTGAISANTLKYFQDLDKGSTASQYNPYENAETDFSTSFASTPTPWGKSTWDIGEANEYELESLGDFRAKNQPWYSKIINGTAKAGVIAATTAVEGLAIMAGAPFGDSDKGGWQGFLENTWNNPLTRSLEAIKEWAEENMPNYQTKDEMENPMALRNIFSANFLGNSIIKNVGFMVGAFYGGMGFAWGLGKLGQGAAKLAAAYSAAQDIGRAAAGIARGAEAVSRMERLRKIASTTRYVTQAIGAVASAYNEGAIEALSNSTQWVKDATMRAEDEVKDKYGKMIASINADASLSPEKKQVLIEGAQLKAQEELEERKRLIQEEQATVGNADLIMNLPILLGSNVFRLGKLYKSGFESTRRQMGSFWNKHTLAGNLGNLKTSKTKLGGVVKAIADPLSEGTEEYLQGVASDASASAVEDFIDRKLSIGNSEDNRIGFADWVSNFGKNFIGNLGKQDKQNEFLVGFVSAFMGMPVFGGNTKDAYIGKGKPVGLAGGFFGALNDYRSEMKHEQDIADYLNKRINNPKTKALYKHIIEQGDFEDLLKGNLSEKKKEKYKSLEFESLFSDINAAASSGHFKEFLEWAGYVRDYSDEELADIVESTKEVDTAANQRARDERTNTILTDIIQELKSTPEDKRSEDVKRQIKEYEKAQEEVQNRLNGEYRDKVSGRFFYKDTGEDMTSTDKGKKEMREILEKNRKKLVDLMQGYLKLRDDIDIESDGKLSDEQIKILMEMRASMWDFDVRSGEMAWDLANHLRIFSPLDQSTWDEVIGYDRKNIEYYKQEIKKSEADINAVKQELDNLKKSLDSEIAKEKSSTNLEEKKKSQSKQSEIRKDIKEKEDELKPFNQLQDDLQKSEKDLVEHQESARMDSMLRAIGERRKASLIEWLGYDAEADADASKDMGARGPNGREMSKTSDEIESYLLNPANRQALINRIRDSNLDEDTKKKLIQEIHDMGVLAKKKMEYNAKIKEFLNPDKLNQAIEDSKNRMNQKTMNNKIKEYASKLKSAESMRELDEIMTEAFQNIGSRGAFQAMEEAWKGGSAEFKAFVENYQRGQKHYSEIVMLIEGLQDRDDLDEEILRLISTGASQVWEGALSRVNVSTNGDLSEDFDALMDELIQMYKDAPEATAEVAAIELQRIMDSLAKAAQNSTTNTTTRSSSSSAASRSANAPGNTGSNSPQPTSGASSLSGNSNNNPNQGGQQGGNNSRGQSNIQQELDNIKNLVKDAIINEAENGVIPQSIDKLPNDLKKEIEDYNGNPMVESMPNMEFTEAQFQKIVKEVIDAMQRGDSDVHGIEAIDDNEVADTDTGEDTNKGSAIREEMQKVSRTSYRSSYPSYYVHDEYFKVKFVPSETLPADKRDRMIATQKLLAEYGAYDFVDKNLLGYIQNKTNRPITVSCLMSTNPNINGNSKDSAVVFTAIEWDNAYDKAIKEYTGKEFGTLALGNVNKLVTIGNKTYKIIGTLTVDRQAAPAVSNAFEGFKDAIYDECQDKIKEQQDKGNEAAPFVVSSKVTFINAIFPGRLEREYVDGDHTARNSEQADLLTLVSKTIEGLDYEYSIGVNAGNRFLNVSRKKDRVVKQVKPSDSWMEENTGHIVLYVPKPDGQEYPIRVIRKTVKEWLESTGLDGKTFKEAIEDYLNGTATSPNPFIKAIVDNLKILMDGSKSVSDRANAKLFLQQHLILGNGEYFSFDDKDNGCYLKINGTNTHKVVSTDEDVKKNINEILESLATQDIKLTIPLPADWKGYYKANDLITAGIFKVRLESMNNFNASVCYIAMDADGKSVQVEASSGSLGGPSTPNATSIKFDFDGETKEYRREQDGTWTVDGNEVDNEMQALLERAYQFSSTTNPDIKASLLYEKIPEGYGNVKAEVCDLEIFDNNRGKSIFMLGEYKGKVYYYDKGESNHSTRIKAAETVQDVVDEIYNILGNSFSDESLIKLRQKNLSTNQEGADGQENPEDGGIQKPTVPPSNNTEGSSNEGDEGIGGNNDDSFLANKARIVLSLSTPGYYELKEKLVAAHAADPNRVLTTGDILNFCSELTDADGDYKIIDEILQRVDNALNNCV